MISVILDAIMLLKSVYIICKNILKNVDEVSKYVIQKDSKVH